MTAPAWSVVVPTLNRPHQLSRCVSALTRLTPPEGGFEVIIVNDGGALDANEASRTARGTATALRYLTQPHGGPAAARNTGARAAAGTWLAFTDDDCAPEPGWLQAFQRALAARPNALAGGAVRNAASANIFSEASQLLANFVANWFDGSARERFFTSNNIALAREPFLQAGGFNTAFVANAGEDRDFCDRWTVQGRPSISVIDAVVDHMHVLSWRSFLRQHHGYGRAAHHFRAGRRVVGRPSPIDPGFYVASLRHAYTSCPIVRGVTLAGCTLVAHTAYVAGLAHETFRVKRATSAPHREHS